MAPGGRLGLHEQRYMAPVSLEEGGPVQAHSTASAKNIEI